MSGIPGRGNHRRVARPLAFVAGCAILLAAAAPALADALGIADDFNDNRRDPAIWAKRDAVRGDGGLTETGRHLHYTVAMPTRRSDSAGRSLVWGKAPYDADWSIQMYVNNGVSIARANQYAAFGFSVSKCGAAANRLSIELYAKNVPGSKGVLAQLWTDGSDSGSADAPDLSSSPLWGLLRLSFNSATKVVTAYHSVGGDPSWTALGTFGLSVAGTGADGNGDWGMTGGDGFCIQPFGYSEKIRIRAEEVYGDDFSATGLIPGRNFLLSPNGGEAVASGESAYPITWFNHDGVDHVGLRYTCNRGRTWQAIDPPPNPGDASYAWDVPTMPRNRACLVKATAFNAANEALESDRSDKPFRIEVVRITAPVGKVSYLTSGTPFEITWTTNATVAPVDHVLLSYSLDGGRRWRRIDTSGDPADDGSFIWTPSVKSDKQRCKVRLVLKSATGRTVGADTSDKLFRIFPPAP